jgi:glycolate oxidase iron-sulfur subunit
MQTALTPEFAATAEGAEAEAILRKCVHCGFCTATCPTYQLLGDELDGPRGRIYLIKQVLEGHEPTRATQLHLDRCLTCRNCETTCPSGVQFGNLVEIGRKLVDERVPRPPGERALRWLLKEGLTSPLFAPAMKLGQAVRPLLPAVLKAKVPAAAPKSAHRWPTRVHPRKVLMLMGCVQPAMMPNINSATARVLDAGGIQTLVADEAGCCGAIRLHGGDAEGAHEHMRRNILTRDVSELLADIVPTLTVAPKPRQRLAFHPPCTLQHGQQVRGGVEAAFTSLGFEIAVARNEAHLCCGSAGTYSVLQPELAYALRDRKLGHLAELEPEVIVSANIGCIQHLQSGTTTPVRHWIEVLDEAIAAP